MQFNRNSGQNAANLNRMQGEYEYKTFTGYPKNPRRSPVRGYEQGSSESGMGEMIYLDPNEMNFRRGQNMSPLNDSRNIIVRSPIAQVVRNEYVPSGGVINMSNQINRAQAPRTQPTNVEIERKDRFSRSPRTLNAGESPQEVDYNIRTLNRGRVNSPQGNFAVDRSYNMMSNETGNIFLDQPMQQGGYVQQTEPFNSSSGFLQQGSYEKRGSQGYGLEQNSREIQFPMNPRDLQEPMPGILRKMSPKGNVEGDSDSNSEKGDNVNQIKDLKTQLEKNNRVAFKNDDGMAELNTRQNRGDIERIEELAKSKEFQENITGEEVKKLLKYYVKTYDPRKGEDGNLISNSQTIIQSNQDQFFNDRYKVLQKMNKLSTILLANKRNASPGSDLNRSYGGDENKNRFDKSTFNNTSIRGTSKRTQKNTRHNKFLYVSLAMISAKGPNCEDRTILRRMRLDKGGVVDLAQENLQKKSKFKIKKARAGGRGFTNINPKYRDKAARIVQAWWRERKSKYKKILEQIIKIQSVWRGKFTRKYVYDIIYISYLQEKFFSIMRNVLVNHVRPEVFNSLFSKKLLLRDLLKNLLEKNDEKYTLLRIRPYFIKWFNMANFLKQRMIISRGIIERKIDEEQRRKLLKKYLDRWALISNLYKYIGKAQDAEEKRSKFFGTLNMINGLSGLSKRHVYKNTKEPIKNYLKDLLKNKILNKIIKSSGRKCLEMKLRLYFNKWKDAVHKGKYKDLKDDVFANNITRVISRLDKIKMKKYLDIWKRHLPKSQKILDINEGAEILKRFTLRTTFIDPLNAFVEKCDEINTREMTLRMLIMKRRKLKDDLRDMFNKWKQNGVRLDDKDKRNDIFKTLLKNILNKIQNRILYKRFNQWRQRPKVDINKMMRKIYEFTKKTKAVIDKNLSPDKMKFINLLDRTRGMYVIYKAGKQIFNNYNKKRNILLRYYFYKWRSQTKNDEISDLHKQLLKYIIYTLESKNDRNKLYKYLTRWRLFVSDSKNYDNIEKLKQVLRGGDIITNLYHRRNRDLFNRLYRKMGVDYRPKILSSLLKRLIAPKSSLRECFDRWRRLNDQEKANEAILKIKGKFVDFSNKNVKNRSDRDKLMKAFFQWRTISKKPDEYYPKINTGLDLLTKYIKKKACNEPFDKIKISINYTRKLIKIFKNISNQKKRLLDGKLRNLIGRWRKVVGDDNIENLKSTIIIRTKENLINNSKIKTLVKYFTRWKLYRRKGLDSNFGKGIDILTEIFKRPVRKTVFDAYKTKIDTISKVKGADNMAKASDSHRLHILRNALNKWWRSAMSIDPNRLKKIKIRLRRIIKHKEIEPRALAFHKWANKVKLMQFRDQDLLRAKKMIGSALRLNDRKTLQGAMSKWKKYIQYLREQYLKSLLVKQIKSSQIVKEQMNNQAILRSALLKWRAKLIPLDYLERLKQIRQGCKLFKLGLKKRDEREIFDNINELARKNWKKNLLKNIIIKTIPALAKYQMKQCINVWKSKLGDTRRMKNRLKILFEDYVYSDKVHDGLFKKPKEQIVDALNNYDKVKRNETKKISEFVGKILKIKDLIRKSKATILLDSLFKKKEGKINDIKKIQFIRFYRQTQKIKNNEKSKIIQNFIKEKLRRYLDRQKLIEHGLGIVDLYLKKKVYDKIKNKANYNYLLSILLKCVNKKDSNHKKLLKIKKDQWNDKIPLLKKNDAAQTIQNGYRTFLAKNKLKNLRLRLLKLTIIHGNIEDKNKQKLFTILHGWLHRSLMIKNNEKAQIIQKFCKLGLDMHNKKVAQGKLLDLFTRVTKHKLAKDMEKASRIIGGKGEVLYKMLQDILYRNPYNKLIDNMKYVGKINFLKKLQPKIHYKLKKYFLSLALRKWKENTYDQTIKYTIILQKFLRDQYQKKMERDRLRRELLLSEIMKKLIRNNLYKLELPFTIWNKKAKLLKANDKAIKIQNMFRNNFAKNKLKDLKNRDRYLKLIKKYKLKLLKDLLTKLGNDKLIRKMKKRVLKIIINRKIVGDNYSTLGNCFNKWRKYITHINDCATRIENAFRSYKAKKERDRLSKIKNLLYKYVKKHDKTDKDILRSKLKKWYNKAISSKYNDKSRIIQNFLKPKLAKKINDRFKKFFYDNANRKTKKLLLLVVKMNKLYHALIRKNLERFTKNLKNITITKHIQDILTRYVVEANKKNNLLLLKKYLLKWRDQKNKLIEKQNESASTIQRAFLYYKAKKEKDRLKRIRDLINIFVYKKQNIYNNKLYSTFLKWLNITRTLTCNDKARIIQDFCGRVQNKINKQKELAKKLKIKNGLEILLNIKFGTKYALEKIISEKNSNIFKNFNDTLKKNKNDKLKECFDKIKKAAFYNKLYRALKRTGLFKLRILRKALETWKDKSNKLSRKRGAELIQKNWKIYLKNKKLKNRQDILKKLFLELISKKSNIKDHYFKRWNDIAQKLKEKSAKQKAAKYIAKRFKIGNARKNWIKLSRFIVLKNRNNNLFDVVKHIKTYIKLNKLKKPFVDISRGKFFDKMKKVTKEYIIKLLLQKLFPKLNEKNNNLLKKYFFKKWKENANKLNEREKALKNALDMLTKRKLINDVDNINKAMILKKLFHDLPLIKAKLFIQKLKENAKQKNKYIRLYDDIIKSKYDVDGQNKNKILNKLYKLYVYKRLNDLMDHCGKIDKNYMDNNKKFFLRKLLLIKERDSSCNYIGQMKSIGQAKKTKLNFKSKIAKNNNVVQDSNAPMKKCLPSFVSYLENIINKKKNECLDNLKKYYLSKKFCELYKKFVDKQIIKPKEELVDSLKREAKYNEVRPLCQAELFKIFRKKYIRLITTSLEKPSRLYKLFYLVNMTKMHKNIASQRFFRELIRKWRFITFTKKMAKKKLELMYKNLHASYLQMADEIFGDDNKVNPSVFKEFERFGSNVGMFTGQEPEIDEEINKKYYSTVDKKYVFTTKARDNISKIRDISIEVEDEKEIMKQFGDGDAYYGHRDSNRSNLSGDVDKNFQKIKKEGFNKKYFSKK